MTCTSVTLQESAGRERCGEKVYLEVRYASTYAAAYASCCCCCSCCGRPLQKRL